jgi:hypothetical protein
MRWLLFLSKLAFICNLFFLLAVSLKITSWITNADLVAAIIIIGYVMVVLLNPVVNTCYLACWAAGKKFGQVVPQWLITSNVLFLMMQIFYILYLNDTTHSKG